MRDFSERVGPYTCMRRLGAGGMAETYLAVQRGAAGFEQRVCVKFILPHLRDDPGFKQLFLREATIAASLRHSNIVGVIDVDQERGYIVLELVDGVDLRTLLNAASNHRLPPGLVVLVAIELCKALSYAHGRTLHGEPYGVVHRDVSPSNVLVSYAGEIKLADFGIAKAICGDSEPQSHSIKGKLCYMSPEQTRNEVLDGRSDLFSLGIVCYELLAGRRPFDGQHDAETILNICRGTHRPLLELAPDVPAELALVVEKLLSTDRAARHENADAVIDELMRFGPSTTAYRDLGDLARRARPHETLSTSDLGVEVEPLARGGSTRAGASQPPTAAGAAASRARRPSPRAWAALAVSLVALAGVSTAWVLRADSGASVEAEPAAAGPAAPGLVRTLDETTAAIAPIAPTPTVADRPSVAPEPTLPEPKPEPVVNVEPVSEPTRESRAPRSTQSERAPRAVGQATLRVGTMPLGQVWINGKLAGWSPVVTQLPAGRHVIAGGSDSPQVQRELRLRAGERRQLVLNLEEASPIVRATP